MAFAANCVCVCVCTLCICVTIYELTAWLAASIVSFKAQRFRQPKVKEQNKLILFRCAARLPAITLFIYACACVGVGVLSGCACVYDYVAKA